MFSLPAFTGTPSCHASYDADWRSWPHRFSLHAPLASSGNALSGTTSTSTTTTSTTTPPPPPPLTLSVAKFVVGKAKSGALFDAVMVVFREDSGEPLSAGKLACAARIGAKSLRLSSKAGPKIGLSLCEWKLAKTAKASG